MTRKLTDVLPRKQADIDGLSLHVSRWTAVPPTDVDPRIIRESIREERKLHVIYRDAQERETARTIWPVALMYYVDSIVLAGWCELRRDYRHFRIDRMAACAKTDALFTGEGRRVWSEWSSQQAARASTVVERT